VGADKKVVETASINPEKDKAPDAAVWDSAALAALTAKVRQMPRSKWQADYEIRGIERTLNGFDEDYTLDLEPDFQRGHVWTQLQQERYIEALIRGAVASSSLLIQFNVPHWENDQYQGDLPRAMQCVDGLQRLTAVRAFAADKIRAFGHLASELEGTPFSLCRCGIALKFSVHTFQTRADLLTYYVDLNGGGTPHSADEIARVTALRDESRHALAAGDCDGDR
jgi:hypothetical protein